MNATPAPGQPGQRQPLSNAERQARFRERRRLRDNPPLDAQTLDMFGGVTPAVTVAPGRAPAVTASPGQTVTQAVTVPRFHSVVSSAGTTVLVYGCPFCGRAPEVYQPEFSEHWVIGCRRCRCFAPRVDDSRLLSAVVVSWHTRDGVLGGRS